MSKLIRQDPQLNLPLWVGWKAESLRVLRVFQPAPKRRFFCYCQGGKMSNLTLRQVYKRILVHLNE